MVFIIAIAIYYGGIDVAVPTFLLWLVVWYGVLFESGLADADDILGNLNRLQACGCGDSVRETIDEAILTYKREVEKMNEKVEKLERNYM